MTKEQIEAIADKIVEDLFIGNALGVKSERLVMELTKPLDGPGWCKVAVKDRIVKAIEEA